MCAHAVSTFGNYLNLIALGLFSYEVTGTAFGVGAMMTLRLFAGFTAGLATGVLSAGTTRRSIMVCADVAQAAVMTVLALGAADTPLWLLAAAVVVLGAGNTFFTVALRSAVPAMVGQQDRARANGLLITARSLAMVLGFASAAPVIASGGYALVFACNAASFVVSATSLLVLRPHTDEEPRADGDDGSLPERRSRLLRAAGLPAVLLSMILLRGVDALASSSHNVALPVVAHVTAPEQPAIFMTQFWAAWAVGTVLAHLVLRRRRGEAAWGTGAFALGTCAMSLSFIVAFLGLPAVALVLAAGAAGFADGWTDIVYTSRLQATPDRERGRLFGLSATAEQSGFALGTVAAAAALEALPALAVVAAFHGAAAGGALMLLLFTSGRRGKGRSRVAVAPGQEKEDSHGTRSGQALCRGPEPDRGEDDPRDAVDVLLRAARSAAGGAVVTVAEDGTATAQPYPDLLDRARQLLTGLRERGLHAGDAVVLCGLPLAEFFPAFWGCVFGGVQPVAIMDRPAPGSPALERLLHTDRLLDRPLVLSDAAGAAALAQAAPELRVVVARDCLGAPPADDHVEPDGADTALLMLSSGSTGEPKAARLTHEGLADFAASSRRILDVRPDDTTVNWLPVDHSGAFLLYHMLAVFTGCTNVHAPTDLVLAEPLRWLDLLHEHRAQHGWAPTFAYQLVADALAEGPEGRWDLGGLKSLVCGGERVALPVLRRFLDATAPYGIREGHIAPVWGMAETVTAVTYGRLDRPGTVHRLLKSSLGGELMRADERVPDDDCVTFVACGSPAHGVTLRVVDESGGLAPEGRIGRLQVHSPARLTPGYVNDPEADAAAFPTGRDWLDTGDLAFLDGDQVVITGRRKDMIIINGHNIYCHEVEEAATAVPGVRQGEVAACGIPHPDRGTEELAVFFVSRGAAEDVRLADEVRAALFTRLRLTAAHVLPVPRDEFPRTPAGKVRRTELRDRLIGGGFDTGTAPASAQADPVAVTRVVREELGTVLGRPVDADLPFYELGLTSVLLVRLRTRLEERLGTRIAQTAFFEHPTAAALVAHLSDGAVTHVSDGAAAQAGPVHADTAPANTTDQRIAVIGLSLRFPGADSAEQFWGNLRDGVDSVRVFGEEELAARA
nr:MFS transporter [Streptomyces antimycoticus]